MRRIRRSSDRFVGRREELASALDALLPLPAGVRRAGPGRVVTLTKEGGIGKTAMAGELADWCVERGLLFPGGVYELACEAYASAEAFLSRLLEVSGVPLAEQRGDLVALLRGWFSQRFPADRPALLVLDNLDDLFAGGSPARIEAGRLIEAALESAPSLRVLATCRWPLGLAEHELPIEVPPLRADEARDVFIENLVAPAHQAEVRATWGRSDGAARELIGKLSGRHPHALVLLARQMGRPGMTLGRLRAEGRADLLGVLADPLAADDEQDRMKKAEVSYSLSYRHLSEPAKRLFERLSRFPGGVWCGEPANLLPWDTLLGEGWRGLIERELDYYALLRWEPDAGDGATGRYVMLPSLFEFARRKYHRADHAGWEPGWMKGWLETVQTWKGLLSGRVYEDVHGTTESRPDLGRWARQVAARLFEVTQANWLEAFEHACDSSAETCPWLLAMNDFFMLSGQVILCRGLAERAVLVQRASHVDEDLAPSLTALGNALRALGEREPARKAYEEALGLCRRLAAANPAAYERGFAMALNNFGVALSDLGEQESARKAYEEALEIRRRLAAAHPAAYEPDVAMTLNNLGNALGDLGEHESARNAYEEALEIRRRLAAAHPAAYEPDVAGTLTNLGNALGDLGEQESARNAYEEAIEIHRRLAAAHPAAYEPDSRDGPDQPRHRARRARVGA